MDNNTYKIRIYADPKEITEEGMNIREAVLEELVAYDPLMEEIAKEIGSRCGKTNYVTWDWQFLTEHISVDEDSLSEAEMPEPNILSYEVEFSVDYEGIEKDLDADIYLIEVGYLLTEDEERLPYSGVYDRNYGYCNDGFYGGGEWYCVGLAEAKEQALKEIEGMSEDAYVVLSKAENLGYEQIKGVDESHQPYDKDGEPFEDMERHLPQNVVYSARKHGGCLEENFVDTTPLEQELIEEMER